MLKASPCAGLASSQGLYAILGMGAVAAAVLGAPISTTVMVFELTGRYALSLALLLTVSIASGLSLAVHGRSYFHWQLEMRGHMLQGGPHRHLARSVRVHDFMEAAAKPEPPPPADVPRLAPDDRLEQALKLFDATGASRIAVVENGVDGPRLVGHAAQVRALGYFNAALIEASQEAHR